ncbi:glycosyltransferase family 4 protein [Luteimonas sp. 8-5]|uniref:glycosyltransferase family 4 protein n=1 Tax=Luteimonas sp. 8-5 TaxID=3039387 RepID=UPI002436B69F|nr:glycosyltransferase family 4 protein [Luteimonas sp. 8-5]MDG6348297.1 glycosyltransferase family 4 protein [Luteimonas sp. 8-5]
MKVAIVAARGRSLVNFRGALIMDLIDRGAEVHAISPVDDTDEKTRAELARMGATSHLVPMMRGGTSVFGDLRTFCALLLIFRRIRPDCLLTYTVKPVVYGTLAGWIAGVQRRVALITGLGYAFMEEGSSKLSWLVVWLYRIALRRAHLVFFQNPDDQEVFRGKRILPERVPSRVVNGSGIDLDQFQFAPVRDCSKFLFIGRLLASKGIREYVDASRIVKARHPGVEFGVVGWIDDVPDSIRKEELDDWVDSKTINFFGRLEDVKPALRDCTVLVLPSYREGTPRTVLEAMATGRAVITTDAPGCRETVVSGENGFLVNVRDTLSLADAMMRFLEDPSLAIGMGRKSREIAELKYDVRKVNAEMLAGMGMAAKP